MQCNDKPAYEHMLVSPDEFKNMICRTFDVLYRESETSGRVLPIALHPYISAACRTALARSTRRSSTSAAIPACGSPPAPRSPEHYLAQLKT